MLMRKGKKWALSCVAISAVVLTGMSATTVNADETDSATATTQSTGNQDQNQANDNNAQADKGTATQAAVQSQSQSATNATQNVSTQDSNANQTPVATSGVATQAVNNDVRDGGHVSDDFPDVSNNMLGYASKFHIFANEATLNTHTNGNVAVGTLNGKVNFGTSVHEGLVSEDISYIQNVNDLANSSFVSKTDGRVNKIIFGANNDVNVTDSTRTNVNGINIDHLTKDETYQDKNGNQYINFEEYFKELESQSVKLSEMDPAVSIKNSDFPDFNTRVISLEKYEPDENNRIVINLDPDVLTSGTPIMIVGLSGDAGGTNVVMNVDTKGQNPYTVTSQVKLFFNDGKHYDDDNYYGDERPNKETEYFDDNHLLWNFYDSTAEDKQFAGDLNIDRPFQGSVLAPKANTTVNANLDGNIVSDKVTIKAESHRWDLQDHSEIETEYERPMILPGLVDSLPGEDDNDGSNIDKPDEEEEMEIDEDGNWTEKPDENNNNEGNEGNTTDPENPEEPNGGNEGNTTDPENPEEPNEGNEGNTVDPEEPNENNNEDNDDKEPDTDKPGEEDNGGNTTSPETPDTDKEEDSDSEEATTDEDNNQNLITNGGSESNQSENNAEEGLLPNTEGNKGESETPAAGTTDEAGTLPQTGEATSIFATIAGVILIIFGSFLKTTKTKKD
ncbi:collagen-binding domain-containing protein [Companilactobacillus sp. HBUAS56275]